MLIINVITLILLIKNLFNIILIKLIYTKNYIFINYNDKIK